MLDKKVKGKGNSNKSNANQTNLWQEILREAMTKKEIDDANIFVFGDKMSGKKSLFKILNKDFSSEEDETKKPLQIDENSTKFGMINYTYLNVKKNYEEKNSEIIGKIAVWIMNDKINKETFLTLVKPTNIIKSMCIVIVDLSRPWLIMDTLKKWCNFINDTFSELLLKLKTDKQTELKENGKIKYNFIFK